MKSSPSKYILAAEILAVILFHAVKISREEKQTADVVFTQVFKNMPLHKPDITNKPGIEYMLLNLIK
jgi:hypothetical protein